MKFLVVLLAAGRSARFGGNKLLADFRGRPVVCSALEAMRALDACDAVRAVVTGDARIAALAAQYGCGVIENTEPERGQSHSIHLAVSRAMAMGADALLFLAADQPLLTGESLKRLVVGFETGGGGIACLRDDTHEGNPAVFAARYYPELLEIAGDRGAKGILRAHREDVLTIACAAGNELADCDTPEALAALEGGGPSEGWWKESPAG